MTLTPDEWKDVTTDTFSDVSNTYSTFDDIGAGRIWYFYTDDTFTIPSDVTRIRVEGVGGGGRYHKSEEASNRGGGGGGYAAIEIDVVADDVYTVNVGTGATTSGGDHVAATPTEFVDPDSNVILRASRGGTLSTVDDGIGDTVYMGGVGGQDGGTEGGGGGGGGGAGPQGPGKNGKDGHTPDGGAGGSGGKGNNGSDEFTGRGGAGGRGGKVGSSGDHGEPGTEGSTEYETFTTQYPSTWSRSWYQYGVHHDSPNIYQGNPGSGGNHYAKIGFDDAKIRSDLSGADVDSLRLRLRCRDTYWHSGLSPGARIGVHSDSSPPSVSNSTTGKWDTDQFHNGWKAGERKWCNLPTWMGNALKSGKRKGFTIGRPHGGNTDDYGHFYADDSSTSGEPLLEITYTKEVSSSEGSDPEPGTDPIPGSQGTDGHDGEFPGGAAGGGGYGNGINTKAGKGAAGYLKITEIK